MADGDHQPGLGGQDGQFGLPDAVTVAVGSAGIRRDQQPPGLRVVCSAASQPPAADRGDRESRSVVIDADVDPSGVRGDVVDPVGDGLLDLGTGEEETVVLDLDRIAFRPPFPARDRQPSQLLALLGIDADDRLAAVLVLADLLTDVTELRVPVRVLGSLERLGGALQAETRLAQQPAHRRRRYPVSLPGQLLSEMPQRLSCPPQRRLRITPLVRLDQGQQRRDQPPVPFISALTTPARPPDPPIR
jgi:hypothetical protein